MTMTASHAALLILWLAVLACLLVAFLERRLLAPLVRLAKVTMHFPDKLLRYQAIARPYSLVTDIEALAGTLRAMVAVLQRNVHQMQRTNETLELRVQAHTQQLWEAKASLSIENARRHEALETPLTHLRTLMRLTQCMSSSLDIKEVLGEIAQAAATLMDAAIVNFWIVDTTTQTLHMQTSSNPVLGSSFPMRRTLAFGEGGIGWVALHRRVLNVPDVANDARFIGRAWFKQQTALLSQWGLRPTAVRGRAGSAQGVTPGAGCWVSLCAGTPGYDATSRGQHTARRADHRLSCPRRSTHHDDESSDPGGIPGALARDEGRPTYVTKPLAPLELWEAIIRVLIPPAVMTLSTS